MSLRMMFSSALLLLSSGLICLLSPPVLRGAQPAAVNSIVTATTDSIDCSDRHAVAKAIYLRLQRAGFTKKQLDRINVSYNAGTKVVTLYGYVIPRSRARKDRFVGVRKVAALARGATTCETRIDNHLIPIRGPLCDPPKVPCGPNGLCIPPSEECNAGTLP